MKETCTGFLIMQYGCTWRIYQESSQDLNLLFKEWIESSYTCWCRYDWHYYSMYSIFINFSDFIFLFPSLFLSSVRQCKGIAGLLWCNLLRSETFDDLWRRVSISDFNHCWIVGGVEPRAGLCNSQDLLYKICNVIIHLHIINNSFFPFKMPCFVCYSERVYILEECAPFICANDYLMT